MLKKYLHFPWRSSNDWMRSCSVNDIRCLIFPLAPGSKSLIVMGVSTDVQTSVQSIQQNRIYPLFLSMSTKSQTKNLHSVFFRQSFGCVLAIWMANINSWSWQMAYHPIPETQSIHILFKYTVIRLHWSTRFLVFLFLGFIFVGRCLNQIPDIRYTVATPNHVRYIAMRI